MKKLVITAGPTREHLDPVRFLSNPSTGRMGFALARAAVRRGWKVTLIAGPVALETPKGVERIDVVSAREMCAAALEAARTADAFIGTAAVADWRPAKCAAKKLKKGEMNPVLKLVRNPDILKTLKRRIAGSLNPKIRLVGFAAETGDPSAEAARKCRAKGLEFIVANDVTEKGCGFGTDTNRVMILRKDGSVRRLPLMTKLAVAGRILDELSPITPHPSPHP